MSIHSHKTADSPATAACPRGRLAAKRWSTPDREPSEQQSRLMRLLGVRRFGSAYEVITSFFETASQRTLVILGFTIPISTTATEVAAIVLVCWWLLSGGYAEKIRTIRRNKVAMLGLAMFCTFAIGLIYSSATWPEAARTLLKYRRFVYIAIFVTLLSESWPRRYGILAFQAAMLVTLAASFLMSCGLVETRFGTATDCAVFKTHITQNILMAFLVAVLAYQAHSDRRLRWLCGAIMLLAAYNLLFMVQGRTGYLILVAIVCLLMFQRSGLRGLALATGLMVCLGAVTYACSNGFRERVNLALAEVGDYYHFQRDSLDSSVGRRLLFYRTGAHVAMQRPLFGTGTGSFRVEFEKMPENEGKPASTNPHSEYVSVLVQAGLLGLGLLLYWFYAQWTCSTRLPRELATLARTMIVAFVVGSFFNSLLSDHTEGWLFCYFTALCYAGLSQRTPDNAQDDLQKSSDGRPELDREDLRAAA